MEDKETKYFKRIVFWLSLLFIGWLIGSEILKSRENDKRIEPFAPDVGALLERRDFVETPIQIQGKVLPVDLQTGTVHPSFNQLKSAYLPVTSAEVRTVIAFDCARIPVGSYSGGGTGYKDRCKVYVIDTNSKLWSLREEVDGFDPPEKKKFGGDATGKSGVYRFLRDEGLIDHV